MKSKICVVSVFLAFAVFASLVSMAHAASFFDTQTGTYTEVTAAVAGNYHNGIVYSPAAYVFAAIDKNLPSPFTLYVYWYFEWEDLNHTIHTYTNVTLTNNTQAGQYVKILPPLSPPSQVIYIYVEGRAGYDGIWDTPFASVGIPFN